MFVSYSLRRLFVTFKTRCKRSFSAKKNGDEWNRLYKSSKGGTNFVFSKTYTTAVIALSNLNKRRFLENSKQKLSVFLGTNNTF